MVRRVPVLLAGIGRKPTPGPSRLAVDLGLMVATRSAVRAVREVVPAGRMVPALLAEPHQQPGPERAAVEPLAVDRRVIKAALMLRQVAITRTGLAAARRAPLAARTEELARRPVPTAVPEVVVHTVPVAPLGPAAQARLVRSGILLMGPVVVEAAAEVPASARDQAVAMGAMLARMVAAVVVLAIGGALP